MPKEKGLVPRTELYERWSEALKTHRILYLGAPLGSGKTCALRAWAELLGPKGVYASAPDAQALPELMRRAGRGLVLIDDLQRLSPEAEQVLLPYLEAEQRHFLLAGRSVLPIWLRPLYAADAVTVYSMADLSFTREETQHCLQLHGLRPSQGEIDFVHIASNGWPAAVGDMAVRMRAGAPTNDELVLAVRRDIIDCFDASLWPSFPAPMQQLLLTLCLPMRFTAPLAAALLQPEESAPLLDLLLRASSGVARDAHGVYTFHPFFLAYLREKTEALFPPEKRAEILRRAGSFFLHQQKDMPAAADAYLRAGDMVDLARVLTEFSRLHPGEGDYPRMEPYFLALPEEMAADPNLICGYAMLHSLRLRPDESDRWAAKIDAILETAPRKSTLHRTAASCRTWLNIALPHRGSAPVRDMLLSAAALRRGGGPALRTVSITGNAPSLLSGGKDFCEWVGPARVLYGMLRTPAVFALGPQYAGFPDIALAEVLYEQSTTERFTEPLVLLNAGLLDVQAHGNLEVEFAAYGIMARLFAAQGNLPVGVQALQSVREKAAAQERAMLLPNIDAMLLRLQLLQGNTDDALVWLHATAPNENAGFVVTERYRYTTKVLLYLQQQRTAEALSLLQRLLHYYEGYQRFYNTAEAQLLMGATLYRAGLPGFEEPLQKAVTFCEEHKFLRLAADWGTLLYEPLCAAKLRGKAEYLETLRAETRKQSLLYPQFLSPDARATEPLTGAEREVLRMMTQGLSNKDISEALCISLSTVKFHASNIYGKLGVKNRTAAVKLALADKRLL